MFLAIISQCHICSDSRRFSNTARRLYSSPSLSLCLCCAASFLFSSCTATKTEGSRFSSLVVLMFWNCDATFNTENHALFSLACVQRSKRQQQCIKRRASWIATYMVKGLKEKEHTCRLQALTPATHPSKLKSDKEQNDKQPQKNLSASLHFTDCRVCTFCILWLKYK